MQNTGNVRIT